MHGRAWLGESVRRMCRWLRTARGTRAFRVDVHLPEHVERDIARFSAFEVGGTHVRCAGAARQDVPCDTGTDAGTGLTVECDNDADRIVHLRRLWATFPALRECAFRMSTVARGPLRWPLVL